MSYVTTVLLHDLDVGSLLCISKLTRAIVQIVGGGTTGLTVAKRLGGAGHTVAVIEAGSLYEILNGNLSEVPAYATRGTSAQLTEIPPLVDWGFITTPQTGLQGRRLRYAQGKTLGGGGTAGTYQKWATDVGDSSFTFPNFLQYFKKSPFLTPPNLSKLPSNSNISYDATAFGESGGPLQVSYSNFRLPFTPSIENAFLNVGLSSIPGLNSGNLIGFANATYSIDPATETRSSAETAFLRSAIEQNEPLTVYVQTSAKKLLFDGNKRATGVQVSSSGLSYTLSATKEVIAAAGVFKTPQLLMVSGIGPFSTLQRLDIPILSPLNGVGQGIWDHPYFDISYKVTVPTDQILDGPANQAQAITDFRSSQTGPLTNVGGDLIGFSKLPPKYRSTLTPTALTSLSQFPSDWPDLELLPISGATFPTNDSTANYASFSIAGVAPLSRGTVTINSTDTNDPPIINPNWLTSPTDQEVVIQGFKFARDLAAASGIIVGPEVRPGPDVKTDAQILDYIQRVMKPFHHASASCKMGPPSDPKAVVSTTGLVYGVTGLRVVDASTFPLAPPGHCQATVCNCAAGCGEDWARNGKGKGKRRKRVSRARDAANGGGGKRVGTGALELWPRRRGLFWAYANLDLMEWEVFVTMNLFIFLLFVTTSQALASSGQCLHPGIELSTTFSCNLMGDEQVILSKNNHYRPAKTTTLNAKNSDTRTSSPQEAVYDPKKPWTHTPVCTQKLEGINEPLCIYTSTTFASGRGISILTKPSKAEKITQVQGFRDSSSLSALNKDQDPPWRVIPTPGRGMGMLATRSLDLGDKITAYTPVFVAASYVGNIVSTQDLEFLFRRAIDQLPEASRDKFMDLAHRYEIDEYRVQDIVQTNCFEFDVDGEMHLAVYPETSRINHSCGANSQYHLNATLLSHQVLAARPIAPGEEITISCKLRREPTLPHVRQRANDLTKKFLDAYPILPHEPRSTNLHDTFHFTCACSRCLNARKSDARISRIQSLESSLADWSSTSPVTLKSNGPQLAQELIKLYEDDGLHSVLVRPYGLLAQEHAALKDAESAREAARIALKYGLLKEGEGGGDVTSMREMMEGDIEGHWAWGKRKKRWWW
ncbi:MAG: hypothetical protein Q9160_008768 [Pyrenula sp. 1 TL-2023]